MEGEDPADSADRDWFRIGLVLCGLLAVVAASFLVTGFGTGDLADSPLERLLPGERAERAITGDGAFGGGGLGALNPGDVTGVGGEIGIDSETFGTTDTEVHFTVESTKGTYWRTGAFDTYTGSGWERTGNRSRLDGPVAHDGGTGERIEYEVTLEQPATAIPTPWRPAIVEGVSDPLVTDTGAIRTATPIEAGTTVEGVSFAPENDIDQLRSAGTTYPDEIEDRYTQLPAETPARIGAHTADVLDEADADDPYEKALAIQEWLRTSKEYDLDVIERDETIADTFVFEMEAGYCEYFATAMATMLRSQDIPARYVVGYSTGQEIDEGVYEVRAMNAHAWVEVYFDGIGWVRFDPTPGNERLATQEQILETIDGEFNPTDIGSPGETFDPGEAGPNRPRGLDTSLNQTAVPEEPIEATVTYNGAPVPGVEVLFNGDAVGVTDDEGTVTGTVPDAEELQITITSGDETTPEALEDVLFGDGNDTDGAVETPDLIETSGTETSQIPTGKWVPDIESTEESDADAISGPERRSVDGTAVLLSTATDQSANASDGHPEKAPPEGEQIETHPIEDTATLVVSGEIVPGGEVTVTARAGDVELSGTAITLDGEYVGETDENGQIELQLPDRTGEVRLGAERDSISGETTIDIPELSVSVETGVLGGAAFVPVTVDVELDDEPAVGVPVRIDGNAVAVTDTAGRATVRLPFSSSTTLSVEAAGQTRRVTVSGLLYVPAAVGTVLAVVLGAVSYLLSRGVADLPRLSRGVGNLPHAVVTGGKRTLVAMAANGDELLAVDGPWVRRFHTGIVGVLTGDVSPRVGWGVFRAWTTDVRRRVASTLRGEQSQSQTSPPMTVRAAWRRLFDATSAERKATLTPGELATHAIEEDDLPEKPVRILRDTFREVEYGSRSPSDRLDRVQRALEQIEHQTDQTRRENR